MSFVQQFQDRLYSTVGHDNLSVVQQQQVRVHVHADFIPLVLEESPEGAFFYMLVFLACRKLS